MDRELKWFRGLILAWPGFVLLFVLSGIVAGALGIDPFPKSSSTNEDWSSMPFLLEALHYCAFAILVVSWFGLWKLRAWGRRAYTLSIAILFLVPWIEEPALAYWQEFYFTGLITLVSGALLAMMWFSEVRHRFDQLPLSGEAAEG